MTYWAVLHNFINHESKADLKRGSAQLPLVTQSRSSVYVETPLVTGLVQSHRKREARFMSEDPRFHRAHECRILNHERTPALARMRSHGA